MSFTPAERRTFDLIRQHIDEHGRSQTFKELATERGLSKVTVFGHVDDLVRKGALVRDGFKRWRCLKVGPNAPTSPLLTAAEAVARAARPSPLYGTLMLVPENLLAELARAVEASKPSAAPVAAQGGAS